MWEKETISRLCARAMVQMTKHNQSRSKPKKGKKGKKFHEINESESNEMDDLQEQVQSLFLP